jgi:tRNA(Leu) C34 or U34 (ribose-2'-O)-methylase TrmL
MPSRRRNGCASAASTRRTSWRVGWRRPSDAAVAVARARDAAPAHAESGAERLRNVQGRLRAGPSAARSVRGQTRGAGGRRDDQRRIAACRASDELRRPAPARSAAWWSSHRAPGQQPCPDQLPDNQRHVSHRSGRTRNPAQHRQRDPAGGQHRLRLHLVEPLGFSMEDRTCAAPGWTTTNTRRCAATRTGHSIPGHREPRPDRLFAMTTRGTQPVHAWFHPGDWLVFGAKPRGLDPTRSARSVSSPPVLRLPMRGGPAQPEPVQRRGGHGVRSLAPERLCRRGRWRAWLRDSGATGTRPHRPACSKPSRSTDRPGHLHALVVDRLARQQRHARAQAAAHRHRRGEAHLVEPVVHAHARLQSPTTTQRTLGISDSVRKPCAMGAPNGPALARSTST